MSAPKKTLVALCFIGLGQIGCVVKQRPLVLPPPSEPFVAVLSGEMPEPITIVSRHAWIVANEGERKPLLRYELLGHGFKSSTNEPFNYFGEGNVALHGVVRADRTAIAKVVACLDIETPRYNKEHPTYFPIPGPNSNTYVDQLLRRCGIAVSLPATCVGKDYRGIASVSATSGGTGVQVETWIAGISLGLKEGVELHILGLDLGIDLWPPAIIVPVNPGRIGFDDW